MPDSQHSSVDALNSLATQVRDGAWLDKAKRNPGLANMWLGRARNVFTQIYGNENHLAAGVQQLPTPASMEEVAAALEAGGSAVDKVVRALSLPSSATARPGPPIIFLGHGQSPVWMEVREFLTRKLGLECVEFNSDPIAGFTTFERLEQMLDESAFAFLIMTAEDAHADNKHHARENVIHEVGLFQGRLGPKRAIILLENGCEEFSNIHGLTQLRFPKGHVSAVFEQMRDVLTREGITSGASATPTLSTDTRNRTLSTEARNLLATAVAGDGSIMEYSTNEGRFVQASETRYGDSEHPRATARWIAGFQQLVDEGLVEDRTGKGEIFYVTDSGYRTADDF